MIRIKSLELGQFELAPTDLPDQQFFTAGIDHCKTLQISLAGRVIFQMDQATLAHQKFLRNFRKCGEDSNLDCHLYLRIGRHHEKETALGFEPLQNSPSFKRHYFRENAYPASICGRL